MQLTNPFEQPGRWFKANLHAHTTLSDGCEDARATAAAYDAAGYQVLAVTDHWATADVTGLSHEGFLVLRGHEYHPPCPTSPGAHHLVGIGVPEGFAFSDALRENAQGAIDAVRAAGGESFLAHPYWCGHRYEQYAYLRNLVGLEVYNSTCDRIGRASSEVDWSHFNDAGRLLPALAVDDCHGATDRFRGWTMLRLPALTASAVLEALRTGAYYATTGPAIHDFRVEGGQVLLRCSPAQCIYLVAECSRGHRRQAEKAKPLRRLEQPVGKEWHYVRAVVVDSRGQRAWTNPIALPG